MKINLYLLGGSGKIGSALVKSLVDRPLINLSSIYIFCDSTKVPRLNALYQDVKEPYIEVSGYSSFDRTTLAKNSNGDKSKPYRSVVVNLRGINNKQQCKNPNQVFEN